MDSDEEMKLILAGELLGGAGGDGIIGEVIGSTSLTVLNTSGPSQSFQLSASTHINFGPVHIRGCSTGGTVKGVLGWIYLLYFSTESGYCVVR